MARPFKSGWRCPNRKGGQWRTNLLYLKVGRDAIFGRQRRLERAPEKESAENKAVSNLVLTEYSSYAEESLDGN